MQISPEYILSRLGLRFLADVFWRPFYSGGVDFGYVWLRGDRVVGLAAGTTARDGLLTRIVRGAPFEFMVRGTGAALRSPGIVAEGLELMRRLGAERKSGGPTAELITLGVLPRDVRPAISPVTNKPVSPAVILLRACAERMRAQGAADFRLYTAAENRLACRLYRSLGFAEARRFQLFGEERICFTRSTSFPDPL
jgi:hypothetical protein